MAFTPYDLEMETTVEKTLEFLSKKELGKAIVCSLRLNEDELVQRVIESVNPDDSKLRLFGNLIVMLKLLKLLGYFQVHIRHYSVIVLFLPSHLRCRGIVCDII